MKKYIVKVNGIDYEVEVEEIKEGKSAPVAQAPKAVDAPTLPKEKAEAPIAPQPANSSKGSINITAPMPGSVLKVLVSPGQKVTKNMPLCILEAMKMENEIVSPQDATVASVEITQGASVNSGDLLITLS